MAHLCICATKHQRSHQPDTYCFLLRVKNLVGNPLILISYLFESIDNAAPIDVDHFFHREGAG